MIYIATNIHGRGVRHITSFDSRADLLGYACEVLAMNDRHPRNRASIDEICEALSDSGPGFGALSHHRVSRKQALEHIRDGAEAIDCWNLTA